MAKKSLYVNYICEMLDHGNFIVSSSPTGEERKLIRTELESDSSPLTPQATALSITPLPLASC